MNQDGKRDYYEVLGVEQGAAAADIKRAYRRMARQYHPDVNRDNPDAEETFKQISEAYAVLSDEKRRGQYDRYGHAGAPGMGSAGSPVDIFDIFSSAFGGSPFGFGGSGHRVRVGRDLRYDLEITLSEVLTGVEREIEYSRMAACDNCDGTGSAPGTSPERCPTCNGVGQVQNARSTFLGTIATVEDCPHCRGTGEVIKIPCEECHGRAVVQREEKVSVSVPAGVQSGDELVLRGFGEAPSGGGRTGDLYVRIFVADDDRFVRRRDDLIAQLDISMVQAALGHELTFETLDGPVEVTVPAGTQHGEEFVINGRGLPNVDTKRRGHLRLRATVDIPRDLSARQRELLIAFASERGEDVHPEDKSLFERIRHAITGH